MRKLSVLPSVALALLIFTPLSRGATFSVTNANNSGVGSLRRAVSDANSALGPDVIAFALGAGTHTITLTSGEIVIKTAVAIDPPEDHEVRISGNGASRVCHIEGSGVDTVTLVSACAPVFEASGPNTRRVPLTLPRPKAAEDVQTAALQDASADREPKLAPAFGLRRFSGPFLATLTPSHSLTKP